MHLSLGWLWLEDMFVATELVIGKGRQHKTAHENRSRVAPAHAGQIANQELARKEIL